MNTAERIAENEVPAVTQWFSKGDPVRMGVYQVTPAHLPGKVLYSFWNGCRFMWLRDTPDLARRHRKHDTLADIARWRGLADSPTNSAAHQEGGA